MQPLSVSRLRGLSGLVSSWFLCAVLAACGGGAPAPSADGGAVLADGAVAGDVDGGAQDGGLADGGASDGGEPEYRPPDAGLTDGGVADGGDVDGGTSDGGVPDGGLADGGVPDGGGPAWIDCPPYLGDGDLDDYSDIDYLRDGELRAELLARVDGHTSLGYTGAKVAMFAADGGFDVRADGLVECVYTSRTFLPGQLDRSGGFNVEHSWPQSLGASDPIPRSDMHHLFPAEQGWNSARGNNPYGDTDCVAVACRRAEAGSELGQRIGGTETVMEVRMSRRGDVARAKFYFAVRYGFSIPPDEEEALRRWNRCDPPDATERARNDAIDGHQGNRNPFIDRPEFVDYIADF